MGLLDRLMQREDAPAEVPCPRCDVPSPPDAAECTACGWDLRESYSGVPGSFLEPSDPDSSP